VGETGEWARMALRLEQLAADLVEVPDVDDTLDGALQLAIRVAPCDAASLSLHHQGRELQTTAASDPVAERAHELQLELGEGPCVDAVWDHDDVNVVLQVPDDRRWPRWGPHAAELGLASLIAVRLFTTERSIGVLDLYSYRKRDYDNDDVLAARVIAARVSAAVANARHQANLRQAIDSRNLVGQAQGILMERYALSADAAFAVLRRYSQEQNRKLHTVAQQLIETRRLPPRE
jgi:transcriptional regulator with GAF, ATPase, and Fis domain